MQDKTSKVNLLTRWTGNQRRIGITGGIASGKSSVGNYLAEGKKLRIIDADVYSREILAPGTSATERIIKRYGNKIVHDSENPLKAIDRMALRKLIFNNKKEKIWLEKLVHPIILEKIENELEVLASEDVIILILPLLFELELTGLCSEIWVIECTLEQQVSRLQQRDAISEEHALKIINSQISLKRKKEFADVIINNGEEPMLWKSQIDSLI